jgi:DNA-binding transcriptional LysR family regulator
VASNTNCGHIDRIPRIIEIAGMWETNMEFKDLEAFAMVAQELHFGRAAEKLHISQPPLSHRIKQLEATVGLQLFDRSTRNVALTLAGQRLLPAVRRALLEVGNVKDAANSIASGDSGLVRIGFAGASSHRSLPLLSRAVRQAHPGIELQLKSQTYVYTAMKELDEGSIDLAFSRLPSTHPNLASRIIAIERLVCAVPEGHPLAGRGEVSMSDMRFEEFVSLPDNQGSILQATMSSLCVSAGFQPNVVQLAPDSVTVLALVAAGVGITITLSSVERIEGSGVVYLAISDSAPSHMFATLAWRKDDESLALRRVLELSETILPTPDISEIKNNPFLTSIGLN